MRIFIASAAHRTTPRSKAGQSVESAQLWHYPIFAERLVRQNTKIPTTLMSARAKKETGVGEKTVVDELFHNDLVVLSLGH
jgi:hypothetical protein